MCATAEYAGAHQALGSTSALVLLLTGVQSLSSSAYCCSRASTTPACCCWAATCSGVAPKGTNSHLQHRHTTDVHNTMCLSSHALNLTQKSLTATPLQGIGFSLNSTKANSAKGTRPRPTAGLFPSSWRPPSRGLDRCLWCAYKPLKNSLRVSH